MNNLGLIGVLERMASSILIRGKMMRTRRGRSCCAGCLRVKLVGAGSTASTMIAAIGVSHGR